MNTVDFEDVVARAIGHGVKMRLAILNDAGMFRLTDMDEPSMVQVNEMAPGDLLQMAADCVKLADELSRKVPELRTDEQRAEIACMRMLMGLMLRANGVEQS